jgi:hypothetical protein
MPIARSFTAPVPSYQTNGALPLPSSRDHADLAAELRGALRRESVRMHGRDGFPPPNPQFRPLANLTRLPAFVGRHAFYVLGATLTRDERLKSLFVDVFFMGASREA